MDGAIRGDENGTDEEKEGDREVTSPTFPRIVLLDIRAAVRDVSRPARRTVINQDYSAGAPGLARGPASGRPGPGPRCVKARSRRNSDCLRGGNGGVPARRRRHQPRQPRPAESVVPRRATPRLLYCIHHRSALHYQPTQLAAAAVATSSSVISLHSQPHHHHHHHQQQQQQQQA